MQPMQLLEQKQLNSAAQMDETIAFHNAYIREHGDDIPEVHNWKWENVNRKFIPKEIRSYSWFLFDR